MIISNFQRINLDRFLKKNEKLNSEKNRNYILTNKYSISTQVCAIKYQKELTSKTLSSMSTVKGKSSLMATVALKALEDSLHLGVLPKTGC